MIHERVERGERGEEERENWKITFVNKFSNLETTEIKFVFSHLIKLLSPSMLNKDQELWLHVKSIQYSMFSFLFHRSLHGRCLKIDIIEALSYDSSRNNRRHSMKIVFSILESITTLSCLKPCVRI